MMPPTPMMGMGTRFRAFVDRPKRYGFQDRARKPPLDGDPLSFHLNNSGGHCIDEGKPVSPGLECRAAYIDNIFNFRGQFCDKGYLCYGFHLFHDLKNHLGVLAETDTAGLYVGTGEVHLEGHD